jgi:hypothetical protein
LRKDGPCPFAGAGVVGGSVRGGSNEAALANVQPGFLQRLIVPASSAGSVASQLHPAADRGQDAVPADACSAFSSSVDIHIEDSHA